MSAGASSSSSVEEARVLEAKADKKRTGFQLFGNKHEEACEMYERAANLFKLGKQFQAAGQVYMKMADCHTTLKSKHETASAYAEAAACFKKSSSSDAVAAYKLAAEAFVDLGRFNQAARYHKEIAQIHETDMNLQEAIEHFQRAAELFEMEDSAASAMECKLRVATHAAQIEDYATAVEAFEKVAEASVDNRLRQFSVRDYLLRAGICVLCQNDIVASRRCLERYGDMDPSFSTSREGQLLADLVDAVEKSDVDAFTQKVFEFDQLSKLDNWKTTLLLRIKRTLQSADEQPDFS